MKERRWFVGGLTLVTLVFFQSCVLQYPPYAKQADVLALNVGVPLDSVNTVLQMEPNDVVSIDSVSTVFLYKYRTEEIKTVKPGLKRNRGLKVDGVFKECLVKVDTSNIVQNIETRDEAVSTEMKKKKIRPTEVINTVTTFLSVTVPAVLVYFTVNE